VKQIERFELRTVILDVGGKTHKSLGVRRRPFARQTDNLNFDSAIFEIRSLDDGERLPARRIAFHDYTVVVQQMQGAPSTVGGTIGGHLYRVQTFLVRSLNL
jgi:hypothetical protein